MIQASELTSAGVVVYTRDGGTDTYQRFGRVDRPPVETRPCTAAESARLDALSNESSIRAKAQAALGANLTRINAVRPTTAAAQASAAYDNSVVALRELNAVIRLLLAQMDDTAGT